MNRVYGLERDRPPVHRFTRAFLLNLSAGTLLMAAFGLLAAGGAIGQAGRSAGWSSAAATGFAIARWPLGILLAYVAITLVFKFGPNRRQPPASWLLSGTTMAVFLWLVFTVLLAVYLRADTKLGETCGPLLGVIGLLLWAYLTALAMYLGIAFAAQLEAVRAKAPGPRSSRGINLPDTNVAAAAQTG